MLKQKKLHKSLGFEINYFSPRTIGILSNRIVTFMSSNNLNYIEIILYFGKMYEKFFLVWKKLGLGYLIKLK